MDTNNFFSLQRFGNVFRNLLMENWKRDLSFFLISFAGFLVFNMIYCYSEYSSANLVASQLHGVVDMAGQNVEGPLFISLLFILGCIYVTRVTYGMRKKGGRIFVLTIPATNFEKWLSRWIVYTFFFFIAFSIMFFPVDAIRVLVFRFLFPSQAINFVGFAGYNEFMKMFNGHTLIIGYLYVQSLFMLLAYLTPRSPMKSVVIFFISIFSLGGLLYVWVAVLKLPGYEFHISRVSHILILLFLSVVNWVLSYIRFTKIGIIDKWR